MRNPIRNLIAFLILIALFCANRGSAQNDEALTPFRRPGLVSNDPTTPAPQRIQRGIDLLRKEFASPTPPQWGTGLGAPIYLDSGVYQANLVEALGVAGLDARDQLKASRDTAETPRLKNLLTIALGLTGDRRVVPELLKLSVQESQGMVRARALRTLTLFLSKPLTEEDKKRFAFGEGWHPLDETTLKSVEQTLVTRLDDPYTCYSGSCVCEQMDYPVRREAVTGLRQMGYQLQWEAEKKTWALLTPQGKRLRSVVRERPVTAADLPPGYKLRPQ